MRDDFAQLRPDTLLTLLLDIVLWIERQAESQLAQDHTQIVSIQLDVPFATLKALIAHALRVSLARRSLFINSLNLKGKPHQSHRILWRLTNDTADFATRRLK